MASDNLLNMLQQLSGMEDHEPEVREVYKRSAFGWPGGKWRSLSHLLPKLPIRDRYVETCGGSGVVLLNRKRSSLEVFNDRFSGVTAFFRCIQQRSLQEELADRLSLLVHSREEFIWACETWETCNDLVERAARWFYTVKTSFGSIGRNWGRSTFCPAMIGPKLREAIPELKSLHHRFRDVQIENLDVIQCIKDYDNVGTVTYIDPDYIDTCRGHYRHEMDSKKHVQILESIAQGKGFFAISGYPNKLYDDPCWKWDQRHTWQSFVSANGADLEHTNTDGWQREDATEVLWIKDHEV